MYDRDDILQQKLQDLENGTPLEQILVDVPPEEKELTELIRLAAQVRTMPHPQPTLVQKHTFKHTFAQITPYSPGTNGNGHRKVHIKPAKLPDNPRRFMPQLNLRLNAVSAFIGVLLIVGFIGSAMLFGGLWLATASAAQAASLENVTGTVEVASSAAGAAWQPLTTGDTLTSGQRLRTGLNSNATLVFFDGSRAQLGPGTDITLNRVDGDRGNVLRVVMTQNAGKSSHQVVPLRGENSTYLVFTPSGTVSVHGTQFSVDVGDFGKTRFAVDTGKVLVANQASQVYLTAGQTLSASPQETLDTPEYQFSLQGVLTANTDDTWTVAGVDFVVDTATLLSGDPQLNDTVLVEGHIMEDGTWVADSVTKLEEGGELRSFSGELTAMEGEEWQVDGHTFLVDTNTQVDEGLMLGDIVQVNFTVQPDGQWLALSVELEEDEPEEPTPTPTPDPEADPILVFDPAEMELPVCSGDPNFNAVLRNDGLEEGDNAVEVVLDYAILSGGEFIDSVSVDPTLFALIPAGESENLAGEIDLADTWEAVADGTSLELRVFIASEVNTPEGHPADLNLVVVKDCANAETPTATITDTVTATPTMTDTLTLTPEPTITPETDCTGANPHPKGEDLAQEYGVPYEEIMGWFCQNYGFGEIDQAYALSLQYGMPVADIFAMRASGMGWGKIKKALANAPTPTDVDTPPEETPEPPEATEAPEPPEPTDVGDDNNGNVCASGTSQHPQGVKLAQRYGVSYGEIMDWYCQGYSFGEIKQAYGLSQDYNTSVDKIFEMRASGMSWGKIKQTLGGKK